jgi:hypothetical protein
MAIRIKLLTCVENMGLAPREISIKTGTGGVLLDSLSLIDNTLGASRIYDVVEELLDHALPENFVSAYNASIRKTVKVSTGLKNELNIII